MTAQSSRRQHPSVSFRTSARCTDGRCVAIGVEGDDVLIADTKVDAPALRITGGEWRAFVANVKGGAPILP